MEQKNTKLVVNDIVKDTLYFLIGSFIFSIYINTFTVPNNIIPIGLTGIATIFNHLFGWPIGIMIILMNIPLFVWGIKKVGYKSIAKTMVATTISSLMIDITKPFLPIYTGDMMLACIFGGLFLGVGLALIFIRGGTTGGTDLISGLLSLYFKGLSVGRLILIVNLIVVICAAFIYSIDSALYAIIIIFVSTKIIDVLLYGTDVGIGKIMFIMSEKSDLIAKRILCEASRGVTKLRAEGAYSGKEGSVLLCAVARQQVYNVYDIIKTTDPKAFIIIGDAGEIVGQGFKLNAGKGKIF